MKEEKRIAVWGAYLTWDGGIDFLCYLVNGLNAIKDKYNLKFFLLLPYDQVTSLKTTVLSVINAVKKGDKVRLGGPNVNDKILSAFNNYQIPVEIVYYNYLQSDAYRKLKKIKAEVLFPVIKSFSMDLPHVAYIPDLQHKHLPHFFSPAQINFRDKRFTKLLNDNQAVFVNAKAVKQDIKEFYGFDKNVFNLPFCPPPPFKEWLNIDQQALLKKFDPPAQYFLISNQFWKHKDHLTAFRAFELLTRNKQYLNIKLFCTGLLQDSRFPEYIQEIKDFISHHRLEERIILLGYIAKEEQIALMNHATALIQPTLFEGGPGGGAVYNAISMGTRCIVSDIPVNKEIENPLVTFFKAENPDDLCQKMALTLQNPYPKPSLMQLNEEGELRMQKLGEALLNVLAIANPQLK